AVLAGPTGAAGRAAALVLVGLGTSRLVGGSDLQHLSRAALLLGLGLGLIASLEPVAISFHAPVLGAALVAAVAAVLIFGGAALAIAAGAGLLPHLMELEDSEAGRAAFLRRALLAPAFALAVTAQLESALGPSPLRTFGVTLLAAGALNVAIGLAGGVSENRL